MKKNWTQAELDCLKAARKSNIRLKIIASALGRSILSIHKRLTRLKPLTSSTQSVAILSQKRPELKPHEEFNKMVMLLKRYHLKTETQEMMRQLDSGVWTKDPLSKDLHKCQQTSQGRLKKSYIHIDDQGVTKLLFEKLSDIDAETKKGKNLQDLLNVPLTLIEYWAKEEGVSFLRQSSLYYDYVIRGQYLTQAQFVLYVNKCRVGQSLLPFQVSDGGEERM